MMQSYRKLFAEQKALSTAYIEKWHFTFTKKQSSHFMELT